MARILFAWELGSGLGHVLPYVSWASRLAQRGHDIVFAVRDLMRAGLLPGCLTCLQAPLRVAPVRPPVRVLSYPDLLHNNGWDDAGALTTLVRAWRALFDLVRPDLMVSDHSPTALLAARPLAVAKLICGSGFFVPPISTPLPSLRPWAPVSRAVLLRREQRTLTIANSARGERCPPLPRLSALFEADGVVLRTFPELDHYGGRDATDYWGVWSRCPGLAPDWGETGATRVFCYLRADPGMPVVLSALAELDLTALIFAPTAGPALRRRFHSHRLQFVASPLDMEQTVRDCALGVCNANHATVARLLLGGKPMLLLPLTLEQLLVARNAERLGAARVALPPTADVVRAALVDLLRHSRYRSAAHAFAERYRDFSAGRVLDRLCATAERLVAP